MRFSCRWEFDTARAHHAVARARQWVVEVQHVVRVHDHRRGALSVGPRRLPRLWFAIEPRDDFRGAEELVAAQATTNPAAGGATIGRRGFAPDAHVREGVLDLVGPRRVDLVVDRVVSC